MICPRCRHQMDVRVIKANGVDCYYASCPHCGYTVGKPPEEERDEEESKLVSPAE